MTQLSFFCLEQDVEARAFCQELRTLYGDIPSPQADVLVVLGGDGFLLETLHQAMSWNKPVFGVNFGSVGFLLNQPGTADNLLARVEAAREVKLVPLLMQVWDQHNMVHKALAFNEVSLLRQTRQAAKIRVTIDGTVRLSELVCDGILVATPAGSTAYNLSAHGPILPLEANLLALTPISAFRPRRWRGALLPKAARICFDVLEAEKRPISAVADFTEIRKVTRVEVTANPGDGVRLLFDPDHHLEERMLMEQFIS